MKDMREIYWEATKRSLTRLLSLLDRNPSSPTYGCFDRSYWLHRKTDFASSTAQLSVRTLALLYHSNFEGNQIYKNKIALDWIEGAIRFTLNLQHTDGSFDEWYPNERGWAGPTGYVAQALLETVEILEKDLNPELKKKIDDSLVKAAWHLAKRDEGEILANHYAIALSPMIGIAERSGSEKLKQISKLWLERFQRYVSSEGWSLEYDGCDLGYNLGTLSFFADIHRRNQDKFIAEYARKAFNFLCHFAYPDGSWAGTLGSRHTTHTYPFALEYWAGFLPEARPLLRHQREALRSNLSLFPNDQEDHYIHYRLSEYIKAALHSFESPLKNAVLPYEKIDFKDAHFPESGLRIQKLDRGIIIWTATQRGGAVRVYDLNTRKLLLANAGCMLKSSTGEVLTSLWQSDGSSSCDGTVCKAPLFRLFTNRFTPFTFLIFRIFCQLMFLSIFAYWFKLWIRKKMITTRKPSRSNWRRQFKVSNDEFIIEDSIEWQESANWTHLYYGGEFHTRYVPQAQYFTPLEAQFGPQLLTPGNFKNPSRPFIMQKLNFETGRVETCVE